MKQSTKNFRMIKSFSQKKKKFGKAWPFLFENSQEKILAFFYSGGRNCHLIPKWQNKNLFLHYTLLVQYSPTIEMLMELKLLLLTFFVSPY